MGLVSVTSNVVLIKGISLTTIGCNSLSRYLFSIFRNTNTNAHESPIILSSLYITDFIMPNHIKFEKHDRLA